MLNEHYENAPLADDGDITVRYFIQQDLIAQAIFELNEKVEQLLNKGE